MTTPMIVPLEDWLDFGGSLFAVVVGATYYYQMDSVWEEEGETWFPKFGTLVVVWLGPLWEMIRSSRLRGYIGCRKIR